MLCPFLDVASPPKSHETFPTLYLWRIDPRLDRLNPLSHHPQQNGQEFLQNPAARAPRASSSMNHNIPPLNHSVVRTSTPRIEEETTYVQFGAERTRTICTKPSKRVDNMKKADDIPTKLPTRARNNLKGPYGQCELIREMSPTKDHGSFLQIVIDCPPRKPQRRPSNDFLSIATTECGELLDQEVGLVSCPSPRGEPSSCSIEEEESESSNTDDSSDACDASEASISLRSDEDSSSTTRFVADFEKSSLESPSLVSHQLVDSISLDSVSSSFEFLPMRDKSLFGSLLDKVRGKKRHDMV